MFRYLNVIFLTAAAGSGFGYLSFCALPADYRSTARILIASATDPPEGADPAGQRPDQIPAEADQGGGNRPIEDRIAEVKRALVGSATLQRALGNSLLLALRWPSGAAISVEQLRQSISFDDADEPTDVIVLHCHAPSAEAPQAILSSVIDAYFVQCSQQSAAVRERTGQVLEQARRYAQGLQSRVKNEAQLRNLVDALGKPAVDSAALEHLSQQRSALLLRGNALRRQLAQMQSGRPAAAIEVDRPASAPAATSDAAAPAVLIGVGAEERVAQLLEQDRTLALRYGANHPKRKAIRIEISLLRRYPADQAQLLAEQWALLQQFGPDHPRIKQIQQRLDELGIAPLTESGEAPSASPAASPAAAVTDTVADAAAAEPQTQIQALQAALQRIDQQDREIVRTVEQANQSRELAADLRQVLQNLPPESGLQSIEAALERLAQLNAAQSALRPYLTMRPALGLRNYAGLDKKLLSGAAAGTAIGLVLALGMLWARGAKRLPG